MAVTPNCMRRARSPPEPQKKPCFPFLDLLILLVALPLFIFAAIKFESFLQEMTSEPERRWIAFALGIGLIIAGLSVCGYVTHRMGVCLWTGPIDEVGNPATRSSCRSATNHRARFLTNLGQSPAAIAAAEVPPPTYDSVVDFDMPPPPYESLVVHLEEYFSRYGIGQDKNGNNNNNNGNGNGDSNENVNNVAVLVVGDAGDVGVGNQPNQQQPTSATDVQFAEPPNNDLVIEMDKDEIAENGNNGNDALAEIAIV